MYDAASPNYKGRCTAPLLVDKRSRRLVCNESSDIVRMLNSVSLPGTSAVDLYPPELAAEIDSVNDIVYNNVRALARQHIKFTVFTHSLESSNVQGNALRGQIM